MGAGGRGSPKPRFPHPTKPHQNPCKECRNWPVPTSHPIKMAHCPSSNVLNAVGAPKSCSPLGEGAGAVQNEEIHSTLMPEFTERLPTQLSSPSPPPTRRTFWPSTLPSLTLGSPRAFAKPSLTLPVSYLSGSEEGRRKE